LGPTNIAGRVTSLTNPENPLQWFAGSAAGGVRVSNDAGQSWNPTWSRFATQNTLQAMPPPNPTRPGHHTGTFSIRS
jgi:hypothetical protein